MSNRGRRDVGEPRILSQSLDPLVFQTAEARYLLRRSPTHTTGGFMGMEDRVAGKIKQAKGKGNDIAGAAKGDTGQQIKGKVQKAVGKVQDALGKKPK